MKLQSTELAKEIHEDSLKKKTAFSACDVFQRSVPCPAEIVAKVRPHRAIARGGSRVTRGKRSVFPKRYLMSKFNSITRIKSNNSFRGGEYPQMSSVGRAFTRSPSPKIKKSQALRGEMNEST